MTDDEWGAGYARSLGVFLNGDAITSPDPRGERVTDDSFLVLFNAYWEAIDFSLPKQDFGTEWELEIDTADPLSSGDVHASGEPVPVQARSLKVLRRTA
jgi:glycogen operon protein